MNISTFSFGNAVLKLPLSAKYSRFSNVGSPLRWVCGALGNCGACLDGIKGVLSVNYWNIFYAVYYKVISAEWILLCADIFWMSNVTEVCCEF